MEEEKDTDFQKVMSNKEKWNDNFSKRHADIDPADEDAYFGAINADYDAYDEKIKGYEDDNQRISAMLDENPAFAQMLVEAHSGGNPWQALARVGGDSLMELMKNPEDNELAKAVVEGMNDYAEKVKRSKEIEEEAARNIGPSLDAMIAVIEEHGMTDEQAQAMFQLWDDIQQGALVNRAERPVWEMLAKAVMHDDNLMAAETEGEMRGKNAKMQIDKHHILKGTAPMALRGQGGGPREERVGSSGGGFSLSTSIWDRDNE